MEYYPRKIGKKLEKWLKRKEIILIKGPRQSGKTTLLLHLKDKLGGNYITLEDENMQKSLEENPEEFAKRFTGKRKNFLFMDEAQYSKKAGRIAKLLFDMFSDKLKLVVTGSGSFDIKVEIGRYLVGRVIYFELLPLDFEEFLLWKAKDLHTIFCDYRKAVQDFVIKGKTIKIKPVFGQEFNSLLEEYLVFGGFPAIVKEREVDTKKELLRNLTRTYLEKDIFFFLNIRHLEKFRNLLSYLGFGTGSLLEISSIMKELNMDYRTAENYLSIMVNTYIISLVPPFHRNLATELKKAKKVYFRDTGLRNSLMSNFLPLKSRTDKGVLFENFIFNELKSNFEGKINYWRTTGKEEVDFVLNAEQGTVPVEVKSKTKLKKGFMSFINTYKPERALVFTEREFEIKKAGKTEIAFIPHFFI
jgi:predicted AAA+ superfamily ATPase